MTEKEIMKSLKRIGSLTNLDNYSNIASLSTEGGIEPILVDDHIA